MPERQGFTLIEIVVVLMIIAIVAAVALPNFTNPTEQARSLNAQNNLLAIYTAEKNYFNNNNGNYCLGSGASPNCGDSLQDLNSNLSLNIQDDSTFSYDCGKTQAGYCTATRSSPQANAVVISLSLGQPVQLTGASPNPTCVSNSVPSHLNWCPV